MKNIIASLLLLNIAFQGIAQPLDDIVQAQTVTQKSPLTYAPIRAADILWKKRIWRTIDVREKTNLAFTYPEKPFFEILTEAITAKELNAYSVETDDFSIPLQEAELNHILFQIDTVHVMDWDAHEYKTKIVSNTTNYEDIKQYRLKEMWYVDAKTSQLRVRILGIAPIVDVLDDNGNFRYRKPLFWVYYPEARKILAKHEVFNPLNDSSPMTWEDLLEMRYFSSTISKESNVMDERLQDKFSGLDLLEEADKIRQKVFNYEHDLWSY